MKEESHNDGGGGGGNSWARVCDTIRAAACAAYCKADMAYLGADCDARVHAANRGASRHERVFVCEACKKAPAAFLCKMDAASLCTACDAAIHSANPLARRHLRVPIPAIWGSRSGFLANGTSEEDPFFDAEGDEGEDEEEVASWLLLNNPATARNGANNINDNNGFLFGGEVEEYLDLVEYNDKSQYVDQHSTDNKEQQQQQYGFALKGYGGDAVVPHVQCEVKDQQQHQINFQLGLNFESSKAANNLNGSICQSVSISSTDTGVVPDSTSEISISHSRSPKGTIDHFSGHPIQMPPQLTPIDREARVLRYREKKKTRKFQKTIRYASRKAYAETRPRIKGRFAKRKNVEVKMDQMFSTTLVTETGYGIVPSF